MSALTRGQALDAAIDQVTSLIAQITVSPKPSYSVDGQSVSWGEYLSTLIQQQENLYKARQMADGPFEVRSQAG